MEKSVGLFALLPREMEMFYKTHGPFPLQFPGGESKGAHFSKGVLNNSILGHQPYLFKYTSHVFQN